VYAYLGQRPLAMRKPTVVEQLDVPPSTPYGFTIPRVNAQAKPPIYFVVENEISDVQGYLKEYAAHARDMIIANGDRYLAAGEATT
jgi:hypothetical protein